MSTGSVNANILVSLDDLWSLASAFSTASDKFVSGRKGCLTTDTVRRGTNNEFIQFKSTAGLISILRIVVPAISPLQVT
jgi:hypothetical protein